MKVLIVYNIIPEESKCAIVDMTPQEYATFSIAHGHYVNCTEHCASVDSVLMAINHALSNPNNFKRDIEYLDSLSLDYYGKWYNDMTEATDISEVDKLIQCGFVL